ncbi:hypothetical protein POG22_00180 [Geitlerinema sp. CS-897]|nr:hypothetical protein [Geitlerinema sp. CS-897]
MKRALCRSEVVSRAIAMLSNASMQDISCFVRWFVSFRTTIARSGGDSKKPY